MSNEAPRIEDKGNALVVKPAGNRLDSASSIPLKQGVQSALGSAKRHLVLDLSGIDFMDSSALGALIGLLKSVAPQGRVLLAGVESSRVKQLIKLTRLESILPSHPSVEAALKTLG